MAKKNKASGLDLSGVGGKRIRVGGGSHHRPGLSFANKPSSAFVNTARQGRASRQAGGSMFSQAAPAGRLGGNQLVKIVIGVLLSLALAIGVGVFVYKQTAQNALKPSVDANVSSVLAQPAEDAVVWSLLVIEQSTDSEPASNHIADMALVSHDAQNLKLSFIWVPKEMRAYVAGYGYMSLDECFAMGDQPSFVSTCNELFGVSLSHVFMGTQDGVSALSTALGLQEGLAREALADSASKKILGASSEQQTEQLKTSEKYVNSDMDSKAMVSFVSQLKGIDTNSAVFNESAPLESQTTPEGYSQLKADDWATMSSRVSSGLDPVAGKTELANSSRIRSSTTVTIWNGVGVSGIAGDCASFIKKKGWQLQSSGNAQSFVYDETLIVYKYDSQKKNAELLASDLGQGRVVPSAARYNYDGDILIVVGKDYKPF